MRYDKTIYIGILDIFLKIPQISKFMKISSVGAGLFHADGHDEANIQFSQF
jgi:hypothetical protein